jgi:phage terminase large subunit-like protein
VRPKLLGPDSARGTGMIPARAIHHIAAGAEGAFIRHTPTGGLSYLGFKSYKAGRADFEGTEQHVIWLDEEPPLEVYAECQLRTMATGDTFPGGIILVTFTPLQGQTQVVNLFFPNGSMPVDGFVPDEIAASAASSVTVEAR